MYYKLPIKERMDLMKSYKKANPKMSYSDMVNDYNTSYQKFDNGGTKDNKIKTKSILEKSESPKDLDFSKKYKIDRESPYNSKLKFEHNPNIDYGLGLNNSSSSISGGIKFLDNNPQYNISANKTFGNFTGNVNSSFATNPQHNINLNYNNKGLNMGAGMSRENMENTYKANLGYNSGKFGINTNYAYNKNSENPHSLNVNANANMGNLGVSGNYGYNNNQHNGALNLNYNKNNLGIGVGANYNKEDGLGAKFNITKRFEYGGVQQFGDGGKLSYPQKVQAYNDSTILFKSGFNKNIPNQIYNPQFNAAKKRLTELNKKEPQSTDYYHSYRNNPEYLKTHSIPYAKPTYPKKDTVLPEKKEKTRTDIYTNKELFDKAYKAETDSSNAYNSTVKVLSSLDKWNKDKSEKNKKEYWKDQNKNLDLTNSQKLNGVSENKIIKPIKTEWSKQNAPDGDIDFYNVYKKPVVHNVYQPPELPEKMIPIEARVPKDIVEPGLKTVPKDFGYRRIGWRNDPKTNLQVPVLLTHPKMKVKQGERIYNKEIPTSTMAIPKDWEAEFSKPEKTEKTDTYWRRK